MDRGAFSLYANEVLETRPSRNGLSPKYMALRELGIKLLMAVRSETAHVPEWRDGYIYTRMGDIGRRVRVNRRCDNVMLNSEYLWNIQPR